MSADAAPTITSLDELLEYRETTERISGFLQKRLKGHLATLSALLAPARVLGKYVGGRDAVSRADETVQAMAEKYKAASGPFDLKGELDQEVLAGIGGTIEVYPFEYSYEARNAKGSKMLSMTSAVKWVVTYASEYSLSQFRNAVTGKGDHGSASVRQFVVNTLAFQAVMARNAGIAQLLKDLRYDMTVEALPGVERLPMTCLSIALPSFRPSDDLLLTATRLSGVSGFIELIDTAAEVTIEDPLRRQIEEQLGKA